jgi:DNA mismatch endonuclease (patch repair protein)
MDSLSAAARSALMAKVKAKGNKSTEAAVTVMLRAARIAGWRRHPKHILGRPDFYFPKAKLAMFIDGCFWHACPTCQRNCPATRTAFWHEKIDGNRRRDNRTRHKLRAHGYRVFRVWEHAVQRGSWVRRLRSALEEAGALAPANNPKRSPNETTETKRNLANASTGSS